MSERKVLVAQSCLTLCNPMECSLPGSSVHGILQARILEWVAIPFSRGSSQPREWTWVSCTTGRFFTVWATREVPVLLSKSFLLIYFIYSSLYLLTPYSYCPFPLHVPFSNHKFVFCICALRILFCFFFTVVNKKL